MNLFNNRIPSTQKNVNSNTITNYPTQTKQNNAKKIEKNKNGDSSKSSFSTSKNSKDKSLWEDFMDYLDKKDPNKVKTFKKDVEKGILPTNQEKILNKQNEKLKRSTNNEKLKNNSNLLENKFPISNKITEKDNIRTTAQRYFDMTKDTSKKLVDTIERFQDTRNKNVTNGKLRILFDNSIKGNGVIIQDGKGNREIRINPENQKSFEFVIMHEMTHDLEGTREYEELKEVIQRYTSKEFAYDRAKLELEKTYKEFYERNGLDLKELDIDSEAISDITGTLLADQNFINQLASEKPNLMKRISNWIEKFIKTHTGNTESKEYYKFLYEVKDKFTKAFKQNNAISSKGTKNLIYGKIAKENYKKANGNNVRLENMYNQAIKLSQQNVDNETIRKQTHWFQDKNGDWKFEFTDEDMSLKTFLKENSQYKLDEIINHDILFELYPDLKKYIVRTKDLKNNTRGSCVAQKQIINLNNKLLTSKKSIEKTLIHEIQHAIQNIEGFERGASIKKGKLRYYNSLGEIEANNVSERFIEEKYNNNKNVIKIAPESSKSHPKHSNLNKYLQNRGIIDRIRDKMYTSSKEFLNKESEKYSETFEENEKSLNENLGQNRNRISDMVVQRVRYLKKNNDNNVIKSNKSLWEDFMDYLDKKDQNKVKTFKKDVEKNFDNYDEKTKERIISTGRDFIVHNEKELEQLTRQAFEEKTNNALHLGRLDKEIINSIKNKISNLPKDKVNILSKENYDLIINQSEIRHLIDDKQLTIDDIVDFIKKAPEIIIDNDFVAYTKNNKDEGLRFKKIMKDGTYASFVLISNKGTLKIKSIHMEKDSYENKKRSVYLSNDVQNTPNKTSKTNKSSASYINNIIHPKEANMQDIKNKKQIAPTREDVKKNEIRKKFEELTHIRILDKRSKKRNFRDIKSNLSNTWDMIVQKTVNSNHYIDKLAKESKNMELKYKADVTLSSSGIGQYNIGVAQTDLKGNKIGLSLQDIFKEIEENNQSQDFSRYMNLRHNTDREAVYRPIFGEDISSQTSNKLAKEYEALYPEFKKYAQSIYDYNNNELNLLVEAGMIDKNLADYMKELYPNYVPVERTIENNKVVSNKELSSGKGIKRATGGNSDILTLKESQASKTMKIRRAIAYNQLIKELAGTLKNSEVTKGELGIDSSLDVNTLFDESNAPVKLDKDGKYKATYFENGESYTFEINKGLYESLKSRQSNFEIDWNNSIPGKMLQKATKFRKDFLTKYNLTFSTMNFIKDIQDAPLNSKYTKDFPKNYAKALKEIASNGKIYNLYMANGGGMNSYFNYENGVDSAVKTKNPIKIAGEKISMANEVIEQAPRLAEFISTIESGGSIAEAMYNSAEITTNFKRGGSIIKALDKNGVPFLNASVQGFDKFYRNFSEQSGAKNFCKMLTKAIMLGAVPSLFNWLLNKDDEDYKDLSESQKDLYYLFKYDNGKFIRIPKGRALSVFGSAVIRMGEKINGNENSFKGLGETISNQVAPNNPIDNNIIAPIVQAKTNKTWYGTDLVSDRLQKQLPKNQYDENTDLLSIFLGEKLNASPKKINYLIDQYSGGIGDIFLPMMTKSASNKGNVFKDKFTVDSVLNNKYVSEFYNTINKQTQIANDLEATEQDNLGLKYLTSIQNEISELYNEKRKIQNSDIKNKEKQEKVREIQEEINTKIKNSLKSYKNVENVDKERNDITKIGETYYIKSDRRVANTI